MGAVPHALRTPAPGTQDPGSALLSGRSPPSQERLVLLRGGVRQAWVCGRARMELGEGRGGGAGRRLGPRCVWFLRPHKR